MFHCLCVEVLESCEEGTPIKMIRPSMIVVYISNCAEEVEVGTSGFLAIPQASVPSRFIRPIAKDRSRDVGASPVSPSNSLGPGWTKILQPLPKLSIAYGT
jgi:hypothetical protein